MNGLQVRVGGRWLSTVAPIGDLEVRHGRNGPTLVTWSLALRDGERPRFLKRNAYVEIFVGPLCVWSGRLGRPDWDSKSFAAIGLARQGEGAECINGAGAHTTKPNTVIDAAIARGVVDWTRIGSFGNTDIAGVEGDASNDDPDPGKLDELLNLWAEEGDTQWRVDPDGRLASATEDEDSPVWYVLPGAGVLGVADDDATDRVFVRYRNSTAGKIRYASYPASTPPGGVERRASITSRGAMTSARALLFATGMYRKAQAGRTGWTNGLELTEGQILTRGGLRANLGLVRAGQTVRMLNTIDPRTGRHALNFVIDESIWRPAEKRIQLNPVGMAARTWEQILSDYRAESTN